MSVEDMRSALERLRSRHQPSLYRMQTDFVRHRLAREIERRGDPATIERLRALLDDLLNVQERLPR